MHHVCRVEKEKVAKMKQQHESALREITARNEEVGYDALTFDSACTHRRSLAHSRVRNGAKKRGNAPSPGATNRN